MGMISNQLRQRRPKNRKNKLVLVFDEAKRRDFLTGFHKRKLQRQKAAKDEFERQLKEERKRIKHDVQESYKKLVVSHRTIPEIEELLADEYEDDEVNVKVTELSARDIAQQNNWIGPNCPKYSSDEDESEESNDEDTVPGMELKLKTKASKEVESTEHVYNSIKDVKRDLKKQATKNVKKSKLYQQKNKMERRKQRKKSMVKRKEKLKIQNKLSKKRGFNKSNKQ